MDPVPIIFNSSMAVAIGLTAVAVVLFIKEWLPVEGVSILILAGLAVTRIVPDNEIFIGFANTAPWMVACLFVVGGATLHTGIVQAVARRFEKWAHRSPLRLLILLLVCVVPMSAFLNNTTVVAVFLPVCLTLSRRFKISPSRLLLPLSFASILGGTCTLIGTSTNIVVASFAPLLHFREIRMFDMTLAGLLFAAIGILYLFIISRRFIPDRIAPDQNSNDQRRLYMTDLQVSYGSPLIGTPIDVINLGADEEHCRVMHIIRGEDVLVPGTDRVALRHGDLILVEIDHGQIDRVCTKYGLTLHADHHLRTRQTAEPMALAEVLVQADSQLAGHSLEDLQFRLSHHVVVLAMTRRALVLDRGFAGIPLVPGDILLVSGSKAAIDRLEESRDVRLLNRGLEETKVRFRHFWPTLGVLLGFVIVASLSTVNIAVLAMIAAALLVGFGSLSLRQAYESIDWRIILLLGSSISLGNALQKTQASDWFAQQMVQFASPLGVLGAVLGVYLVTAILTEFVTNNAAAAIVTPFAFSTAQQLGLADPTIFLMAVLFGASSAFATPVGYQTNTFVYGPGGYRFMDFLLIGVPLKIILFIAAAVVLPLMWPIH